MEQLKLRNQGDEEGFFFPQQDCESIVSVTLELPSLKGETVLPSYEICVA